MYAYAHTIDFYYSWIPYLKFAYTLRCVTPKSIPVALLRSLTSMHTAAKNFRPTACSHVRLSEAACGHCVPALTLQTRVLSAHWCHVSLISVLFCVRHRCLKCLQAQFTVGCVFSVRNQRYILHKVSLFYFLILT